ncbi:MAG TPA: hypothetical protein VF611_10850 [Pyrinomonadaceae bacterium]|jgi:hypothetical protein
MSKRDTKEKIAIPTRTARPKGDMFRNLRKPEEIESLSIEEIVAGPTRSETVEEANQTTPHQSPPLPTTPQDSPPLPSVTKPSAAPARDFNRRANSLEREAMPQGLFPGSSKKIYDALYLRSRGAHPPRTRARASRRDFLNWTDIRNLKTVDGHLRYLISVGLIIRHWELGSTEGSEYEVRLPEELPPLPTTPHHSPPVTTSHFLGSGYTQNLGSGGYSQPIDYIDTYGVDKTLLKTNIEQDDDEAFAGFAAAMKKVVREVTGREPSAAEAAKWSELADVLATELKIAAGRTTVSSVPAFLAEHLRRRLWKKEKRQIEAEAAEQGTGSSAIKIDASKCPDCFGTGMYYPEGFEKGVARCPHSKLTTESSE